MRALVLDFDGVIVDSARESFAVAVRTYRELRPGSSLPEDAPDELYRRFLDVMPLGNGAADYGAQLAALEAGLPLEDQRSYDRFRAAQDADWLARYHRRFYEVREALSHEDPAAWVALMRPYAGLVRLLRRRRDETAYAIATSKDRRSVDALLDAHALADLFPAERIVANEAGPDKATHLRRLAERLDQPFAEMTFVDDKVNHLDRVAPLGVRCALAAWGYNGNREHELARRRGYLVCRLDDAEARLF